MILYIETTRNRKTGGLYIKIFQQSPSSNWYLLLWLTNAIILVCYFLGTRYNWFWHVCNCLQNLLSYSVCYLINNTCIRSTCFLASWATLIDLFVKVTSYFLVISNFTVFLSLIWHSVICLFRLSWRVRLTKE